MLIRGDPETLLNGVSEKKWTRITGWQASRSTIRGCARELPQPLEKRSNVEYCEDESASKPWMYNWCQRRWACPSRSLIRPPLSRNTQSLNASSIEPVLPELWRCLPTSSYSISLLALQLVAPYIPLSSMFHTTPLKPDNWSISLLPVTTMLLADELRKVLRMRI